MPKHLTENDHPIVLLEADAVIPDDIPADTPVGAIILQKQAP